MSVGHNIKTENAGWTFGGSVPDTFVEHIKVSVPNYTSGHDLICQLSDFFVMKDSVCYEIGTSTGELLRKLAEHNAAKPDVQWYGYDVEDAMIDAAKRHCAGVPNITIANEDIRITELEKSDFIVSYYTMQFIQPRYRQEVFNKIYESLNWGGAFIIYEKVRGPDARFQDILTQLYNDFKLRNGFEYEEIVEKTRSLKGVLEPFSTQGNLDLLERAGFKDVMSVQKYLCFEGFLAVK